MNKMKLKRGEQTWSRCTTEHCSGSRGRCYLCGGEYEECMCGDSNLDACICSARAESFWDINQVKWLGLFKQIFYTIQAMFCGDFWWITHGWRGK